MGRQLTLLRPLPTERALTAEIRRLHDAMTELGLTTAVVGLTYDGGWRVSSDPADAWYGREVLRPGIDAVAIARRLRFAALDRAY